MEVYDETEKGVKIKGFDLSVEIDEKLLESMFFT
jgi:hypothetical protein